MKEKSAELESLKKSIEMKDVAIQELQEKLALNNELSMRDGHDELGQYLNMVGEDGIQYKVDATTPRGF